MDSIFRNCELALTASSLCVRTESKDAATSLVRQNLYSLARQAEKLQRCEALIFYPGCDRPFQIPSAMAANAPEQKPIVSQAAPNLALLGSDYLKVWELLQAEQEAGKIVIFTSNVTRDRLGRPTRTPNPVHGRDFCYKTSSTLLPSRATWTSDRWTGYNYRLSWRKDRHNFRELNPEYDRLKELLERDQVVSSYHYRLYRPPADDEVTGALCEYSTTYYRLRLPFYNDEVRVGVSDPNDWRVIEEGQKKEIFVNA